jgi:hypothetical protein
MRYQSKKRAALMRSCKDERQGFVEAGGYCWVCGVTRQLCCHEMTSGTHRDASLDKRFTWLCVCSECNCGCLTDKSEWPLVKQLAVKWIYDREHFDVEAICLLMGRSPDAIYFSEVSPHICRLLDGR